MRTVRTSAIGAGVAAALGLFVTALFVGRADLAVDGVVLVCACAAASVGARPSVDPEVRVTRRDSRSRAAGDGGGVLAVPVVVEASVPHAEALVVRTVEQHHRTSFTITAGAHATVVTQVRTVHSGAQTLLAADVTAVGADGVWSGTASDRSTLSAVIEPEARRLPHLPVPAAPRRLNGAHDAPRAGDGGEFRDIHPFVPGDRLQRIDWKATARLARRPGDLFVRRTMATSDIDVAIVLDDGDDVTGMLGDWALGDRSRRLVTSLDVAREAAWSLASSYLDLGDEVSFQVLSRLGNAVPRGSGPRHRARLRSVIVQTTPQQRRYRSRTPQVAAGAVVVLLSTLLDDESLRLVGLWRAGGHRVIAVDTLPVLRTERLRREEQAAARIVLGVREDRIAGIRAVGADVLVWSGDAGARVAALRSMSRQRRRA